MGFREDQKDNHLLLENRFPWLWKLRNVLYIFLILGVLVVFGIVLFMVFDLR